MADIPGRICKAFCEGVRKIDALAEGMTSDGGLCRRDAHALLKDANEVEDGAAVEEEAAIAYLALNLLSFALALDAEDLQLVRLLVVRSLITGLVAVLLDQVVLGARCDVDECSLEAVADVIDRVQRATNGLVVKCAEQNLTRKFDVRQGLNRVKLRSQRINVADRGRDLVLVL